MGLHRRNRTPVAYIIIVRANNLNLLVLSYVIYRLNYCSLPNLESFYHYTLVVYVILGHIL